VIGRSVGLLEGEVDGLFVGLSEGDVVGTLVGPFVGEVEGDVEGDDVSGPLITSSQTPLALHNPEQHSALSLHELVLDAVHAHTNALFKLHPVAAVQRSSISSPVHNLPPS